MHLSINIIRRFINNFRKKLNKILISFFIKNNYINLLCYLFILNFKKIKQIEPKNKIKFKVIVLAKSGGIEDIICSQRKYNKNIKYLNG